jgi:magnesium-transporting ATPase (P-type)
MQTPLKTMGLSTLISFPLIFPFMIMEVVNRRNFNESFPFVLFFVMWFNLFAISLILLPILRASWTGSHDMRNSAPARGNTVFTNPRWAAIISIALILFPGILLLLNSLGWLSLDRLVNGPNPEVAYLPGLFIFLGLIMFPVAAGIIAVGPIVGTLQTGGRLLTHPIHLIIVVLIMSIFVIGFSSLLIDQWPCFVGVPNCD